MRRATSIARFTRRKTLPAVAPRLAALVLSIGCAACSGSSPTPNNDNTESDSDEASTQATSTTSTNSTLPTSGGDETQTDQELSESTSDGVDSTSTDIDTSTTATTNGSDSDSTITSDQSSETSSDSTQTDTQDELEPCPAGTTIEAISSGSYYAQPGVVFASAPITGNGENHAPKKLEIKTSRNGQAVAECKVRWLAEAGNGWAFAAEPHTDAQGINYAYWTAGDTGTNLVRATIDLDDGSSQSVAFSGEVSNASSRTDSVWLTYDVDSSYDAFKIRITPRSGPANTYYSALNWRDSYAGIQFVDAQTTMVLFSVWDAGGEKAKITDPGVCNELVGFGGEGTGTSCRLRFPPADFGAVEGLPDDYMIQVDHTYELALTMQASASGGSQHQFTFTDITRNLGPISLGTQTTGTAFQGGGQAAGFVEEWAAQGSCLSNARRVEYHDLQARVAGQWQDVKRATFAPNYVNTNNEICANYLAEVRDGRFFMSSGGSDDVGPPYVPGDANFPRQQPALVIP